MDFARRPRKRDAGETILELCSNGLDSRGRGIYRNGVGREWMRLKVTVHSLPGNRTPVRRTRRVRTRFEDGGTATLKVSEKIPRAAANRQLDPVPTS